MSQKAALSPLARLIGAAVETVVTTQQGRCPHCNAEVTPGSLLCDNCGDDLADGVSAFAGGKIGEAATLTINAFLNPKGSRR